MFGLEVYKDKGKEAEKNPGNNAIPEPDNKKIIYQYHLLITVLDKLQNELRSLDHKDPQFDKKHQLYEVIIRAQLSKVRSFRQEHQNVAHEYLKLSINIAEKKQMESLWFEALKRTIYYYSLLKEYKKLEAKELLYWDPLTKVINHPDDMDNLYPILTAKEKNLKKRSRIVESTHYFPITDYAQLLETADIVLEKKAGIVPSMDKAYLEIAALSTVYSANGLRIFNDFSRLQNILQQQKSEIANHTLYIAILGKPGSGKSIVAKQLGTICAGESTLFAASLVIQENALHFSPQQNPKLPPFIAANLIIICIDATDLSQLSHLSKDIKTILSSNDHKNLILAVNKCDLLSEEDLCVFRETLLFELGYDKNPYPIAEISAEIGINCHLLTAMVTLETFTSGGSRYTPNPLEELVQNFSSLWAKPDHPPSKLPALAGYQSYQKLNAEIERHKSGSSSNLSSNDGNPSTDTSRWSTIPL